MLVRRIDGDPRLVGKTMLCVAGHHELTHVVVAPASETPSDWVAVWEGESFTGMVFCPECARERGLLDEIQ